MKEERLFHSVARQISDLIEKGEFPYGTRLPGERELAERFSVSRVTIREAEIALQAIGLVEIKTGSGVYVCDSKPANLGALPSVSAFELTEARSLIEAEAAALAAKVITDAELEKLQTLTLEMASPDKAISTKADGEFHATIARASGNKAMLHVIETLWRMREELSDVKQMYESVCDEDASVRAREHQDILDALLARDPVRARDAMRQHFLRLIGAMLDVSERQALEELQQRVSESRERFLSTAQIS